MSRLLRTARQTPTRSEMRELGLGHLRLPVGLTVLTFVILLGLANVSATLMSLLAL